MSLLVLCAASVWVQCAPRFEEVSVMSPTGVELLRRSAEELGFHEYEEYSGQTLLLAAQHMLRLLGDPTVRELSDPRLEPRTGGLLIFNAVFDEHGRPPVSVIHVIPEGQWPYTLCLTNPSSPDDLMIESRTSRGEFRISLGLAKAIIQTNGGQPFQVERIQPASSALLIYIDSARDEAPFIRDGYGTRFTLESLARAEPVLYRQEYLIRRGPKHGQFESPQCQIEVPYPQSNELHRTALRNIGFLRGITWMQREDLMNALQAILGDVRIMRIADISGMESSIEDRYNVALVYDEKGYHYIKACYGYCQKPALGELLVDALRRAMTVSVLP